MGFKRKDTISEKPVEYAKHLRKFGKKEMAKAERRAAKKDVEKRIIETFLDGEVKPE